MPKNSERPAAFALPNKVVLQLAQLAGVPPTSHAKFGDLITFAIVEADIDHPIVRGNLPKARLSDVVRDLRSVRKAAKSLDAILEQLGHKHTDGRRWHARVLAVSLLPNWSDYRRRLKALIAETSQAEQRAKSAYPFLKRRGRPKGIGGNRAFDTFVGRLYEIARRTGGRWSHSKVPDEAKWKGSLMEALEILKPYLPQRHFFPNANLGRSLEHLIGQLRAEAGRTKNPSRR
jgi:hypothetical protein